MSEDWVKIEVNGEELEAKKGSMLIEVTDAVDIKIPRFCYHKKLSVAANCRMCLVEVERAPKPLPACATPVMDGMKVWTHSAKALEAQQGTMEFLLINHPLDCPICDQGGECELQDVSIGYGSSVSRFTERKRAVPDKDIGPLIETEMTRCIHCTRCVRFGEEISGLRELGATGRGEDLEIGTYIEHSIASELSGNVIDLCPVGALTSKPARHSGRSWEYVQHTGIAPHDSVGSNIYIHTIRGKVMRVVPRENEAVNEVWLSDRDRFSYEALYSDDRAIRPWLKAQGAIEWNQALDKTSSGLKQIIDQHGPDSVGFLISPNATLEELYLTQKLARGLGINNIDSRLRQADFIDTDADPVFPWLGQSLEELDTADAVLLVGSNVRMEQPLAGHRIRKAALNDSKIMLINPRDYDFRFPIAAKIITDPAGMLTALAGVAKALVDAGNAAIPENLKNILDNTEVSGAHQVIAEQLSKAENATILLGNQATAHPAFSQLRALAVLVSKISGAALGYLSEAANTVGAWLSGAMPHRLLAGKPADKPGLDAQAMVRNPRKAYVLLGIEPEFDCWNGSAALQAIQNAEFVVTLSGYASDTAKEYADVILPAALFTETSGTYVNMEGRWQSFSGACQPLGEARPAWKILRVLGNQFGLEGFDYLDSQQVLNEIQQQCESIQPDNLIASNLSFEAFTSDGLMQIVEVPIYATDAIVRRAQSLQQTTLAPSAQVRLNDEVAKQLGLHNSTQAKIQQNGSEAILPLVLDNSIPVGCVWVAGGLPESMPLGPAIGPVELSSI